MSKKRPIAVKDTDVQDTTVGEDSIQSDRDLLRFRPKARIIRTIGDQLISGAEAALIELVKNSYDADASFVAIKFHPPLTTGTGRISITDDGHGMSLPDIEKKWMEPATSSKAKSRVSAKKSRRMMGSKGIGRFAAAKLGQKMSMTSTSEDGAKKTAVLIPELDWSIFSEDTYLSDVAIEYLQQPTEEPTGTTIEVTEFNEDWSKSKIEKLHLELRRLLSPFSITQESEDDFRVYLDLSDCTEETCGFSGADIVHSVADVSNTPDYIDDAYRVFPFPLLSACDYELSGKFEKNGAFQGCFRIHRAGLEAEDVSLDGIGLCEDESPNSFSVKLYLFDREAASLKNNMKTAGLGDVSAKQAREMLDNISGVAIYRSGFRVRPYGDPEHDWLALDTRRVQDPSLRIGHNQVAGYITIRDEDESNLIERSSREGFEENMAFQNLSKLVKRVLAEIVEPKRYQFRSQTGISRKKTSSFEELKQLSELKRLRAFVQALGPEQREEAEEIIDVESARLTKRIENMEDRQRVLEAKSSLGAILAEVLHEGSPEATFVARTSDRLDLMLKSLIGRDENARAVAEREYARKVPLLQKSGEKLSNLFKSLRPLAGGKRGNPVHFFPVESINSAAALFEPHATLFVVSTDAPGLELIGFPEDLATALVNLFGNSVHWLEYHKITDPKVEVTVFYKEQNGHIIVRDNGKGVPAEFVDSIFDLGFTLKEGGTGLGLSIAREALARSGAKLLFHPDNEVGAAFEIVFPAGEYDES